jgi:RNA polymerase sigma-70 factor (ECF subfamily)
MNDRNSSLSDEKLMDLCKQGIEAAFTTLYLRYRQPIMNFARRMVENQEDAADVFQETFRYVFAKIGTYQPKAKFSTLVYQVARNISIDVLRRKRRSTAKITLMRQPNDTPSEFFEKEEVMGELRSEIAKLTEQQREILILRFGQGLSYDEIRDILGIPLGTVQSRIHNSISALRERLVQKGVRYE